LAPFPRHAGDPSPAGPVWADPAFARALADAAVPAPEHLPRLRGCLLAALDDTNLSIERRFA
jgi:hypothetical protein